MILSNKKFLSQKDDGRMRKRILISGGFEIFHEGHLEYIKRAEDLLEKQYEDNGLLFIVVNGDEFIRRKHGREPVFSEKFRANLLDKLCPNAYITIYNKRDDMVEILEKGHWDYFGNGGDRKGAGLKPEEVEICQKKDIAMVNLGSEKLNSTSDIIKKIKQI